MHTSNTAITPNILFFIMLLFLLIIALHTATFYNIFVCLTTIILLFIAFFVKVKISFKVSKGDYDMSDTKETEGYTTVELTLDNDEVIECAILTVYEAAGRNTLPCCLWTKILSRMKLVMFIFISIMKPRTANLTSATLKTMKNMKLQRMHLMNGWILRNSTNQTLRSNSDTKREGRRSFPFFLLHN